METNEGVHVVWPNRPHSESKLFKGDGIDFQLTGVAIEQTSHAVPARRILIYRS